MKKGIFLLHEGIGGTIFESQVVELILKLKEYNVELDIICFNTQPNKWETSLKNLQILRSKYPNINIILKKGFNRHMPFSLLLNWFLLLMQILKLKGKKYEFIHARADYSAFLSLLIRPVTKLSVIWDCRGDTIDEFEEALEEKNKLLRLYGRMVLIPYMKFQIKQICKKTNGALFVSQKLYELNKSKLKTSLFYVIPCCVNTDMFYFSEAIRASQRKEFGLSENNYIYVYSGSTALYQSLQTHKDYYENILRENKNNIILFLTKDIDKANSIFEKFDKKRLIIMSVDYSEMNKYLNMADYALLIRDSKMLNWVSSPTKLGEYCLCGLQIIMNNTIEQAVSTTKIIGNYINMSDHISPTYNEGNEKRLEIAEKSKLYFSRENYINNYIDLYGNV